MKIMKRLLAILAFVVIIGLLFIYLKSHEKREWEQKNRLTGTYHLKGSANTRLSLLPGSMFTLDKKLNATYYGDGNWFIENNLCILYFENGEVLELECIPEDSILVNKINHILLQKIGAFKQ